MSNKKYGLILSGTANTLQPKFQATRNVFGDDSDSDDELKKKPVLVRPSHNINRQAKLSQEKALKEDPTVYQYDEVFDSMSLEKIEKKVKNKEEKKPKYIENLLKTANKRKIENERRVERQIQKEREKEGDEFADKEIFVTSAYKKKLAELKLEEEKERREEYLENIGDVTKQKDLGGFYRHLYEQRLGSDKPHINKGNATDVQQHKDSGDSKTPESMDTFNQQFEKSEINKITTNRSEPSKKRNYRKRKTSEVNKDLSEGEINESDDEINRLNLTDIQEAKRLKGNKENIDADSDFSIDDSSDEENNVEPISRKEARESKKNTDSGTFRKPDVKVDNNENKHGNNATETPVILESKYSKPKIDIWKKRTIGDVFEQALKRFYERKASRGF